MSKVTDLAAIRAQIKAREEWYAAMQKRLHENEHNPAIKGIIENHLSELDSINRRAKGGHLALRLINIASWIGGAFFLLWLGIMLFTGGTT